MANERYGEAARDGLALDLGRTATVTSQEVRSGLARLVADAGLRARLREAALSRFPVDPTAEAAKIWLHMIHETRS